MSLRAKRYTKFDALTHAISVYDREAERCEAERCETGRAFLAGCILQGALLEGSLTAMAIVYRESVWNTARYKKVKAKVWNNYHRSVRWLRDFSLNDLERISQELRWASGLHRETNALRDMRNLVHIGKFADESGRKKRISEASYKSQYSRLRRITDALAKKLEASIGRTIMRAG